MVPAAKKLMVKRSRADRPNAALMGEIERSRDREGLGHPLLRGAVANHDIHLVRAPAEKDHRHRAAAGEALEARPVHRAQLPERRATWRQRSAPRAGDRVPAHNHDRGADGREAVGGDQALGRPGPDTRGASDKQRARVGHRAGIGRRNPLPTRGGDEANAVRPDDPPAGAGQPERDEDDSGKEEGDQANAEDLRRGDPRASLLLAPHAGFGVGACASADAHLTGTMKTPDSIHPVIQVRQVGSQRLRSQLLTGEGAIDPCYAT